MRVVYEAMNLIDAHLVRHALEHAGMLAFVRGEALLGGIGELPACGLLAVCVSESDLTHARDIIATLPLLATETADAVGHPWPDGLLQA